MRRKTRIALLIAGLGLAVLLAGCPGMPGVPGGGASSAQSVPPGLQPPPGAKSGGTRTLMGATITAPEDSILLVRWGYSTAAVESASWQSCRRVIPLDATVIVEGLNFDGRDKAAEKDVNQLLPLAGLQLFWKYELKPTPPPQPQPQGKVGRPGPPSQQAPPGRRGR